MITTRPASKDDVAVWRALRRDGIERYPSAFMASLSEHDAIAEATDAERLSAGDRFLAIDDTTPVGLCGVNRHSLPRAQHRAEIGPFYVIPDAQGTGAADALLQAAFDHARATGVWQVELTVNEDNTRAQAFYKRHGFHQVGRIPNAILGADGPEHDLMFVLFLPPA